MLEVSNQSLSLINLLKCYQCKGTIVLKDLKAKLSIMYRQCAPTMYESMAQLATMVHN